MVFDCAARYRGTSLNDQLLSGPDLANSLFGDFIRFRQEPVALSSDIEAMFHQVMVDPKDVDALRFLWWPDDDLFKRPVDFRMMVHLFGRTYSPSCASFGLRKTAQDNAGDFARLVDENGRTHCSFLAGKSRLAHMKQMTIPRLELSAAVLAVRMNQTLQEEFQLKFDRTSFWTDSTAVLQYIKNKDKRFYTFVANRLAVIHESSEPSQWKYVPTNINPADDVSRGLTVKELLTNERWFTGPAFLREDKSSWPINPISLANISDDDPEVKTRGQTNHLTRWRKNDHWT